MKSKFFAMCSVLFAIFTTGCVSTGAGPNSYYCYPPDHISGAYDVPVKKHPDSYSYTRWNGKVTVDQQSTSINVERYWNPVKGKWDVLKNVSENHTHSESPDSTLPRWYGSSTYYPSGTVPAKNQIQAGTVYGPQKPAIISKLFGAKK